MLNYPKLFAQYLLFDPSNFNRLVLNELKWFFSKYCTESNTITKEILGSKMKLDLRNKGISHQLFVSDVREISSIIIFLKTLKRGEKLLDLGANIGYYSLLGSRIVGNRGKVFSVEPDLRNFTLLEKNIEINNPKIFETYNIAISDKSGEVEFLITQRSNVNTIYKEGINFSDSDSKIKVKSMSIDDFYFNINNFDYIRMDIEGSEVEVLKGMDKLLSSSKPLKILFETHPMYYSVERDIVPALKLLFSNGFRAKFVETSGDSDLNEIKDMGYKLSRIIKTDFFHRVIVRDLSNEDLLKLVVKHSPKSLRSIYLERS